MPASPEGGARRLRHEFKTVIAPQPPRLEADVELRVIPVDRERTRRFARSYGREAPGRVPSVAARPTAWMYWVAADAKASSDRSIWWASGSRQRAAWPGGR